MFLQTISVEATIRVVWKDGRIKINIKNNTDNVDDYILFNRDPTDHLWFPDIFINKAQEIRVPVYKIPPVYLRIYESHKMMYSARVNFDLSCPMKFNLYPVDQQQCDIILESWGHPSDVLRYYLLSDALQDKALIRVCPIFQISMESTRRVRQQGYRFEST